MNWISVEDKLPDDTNDVLIWVDGCWLDIGYCGIRKTWFVYACDQWEEQEHVTHWMPFPEPPKFGDNDE